MTRLVMFPGLSGRVLGAVSAVRAALSRAGGKARVDKAAQAEVLRLSLADAARRRVHPGGRHDRRPAGDRLPRDLGFGPPGRLGVPARTVDEPRLAQVARRIGRAGGLLAVIEAARRDERTGEVPGFARPRGDARGARRREARGGPEIGREGGKR